jgi:hypothetical protein
MGPGGAMVTQRPAAFIARVAAVGVVLGPGQAGADPGTALEVRVQGVERVGADLAGLDLTQDGPDDAPDVALMGRQRGLSQVGDFEVLVEDQAERGVPVRHLVALRLPEHPAECGGGGCLVGACLPEAALFCR